MLWDRCGASGRRVAVLGLVVALAMMPTIARSAPLGPPNDDFADAEELEGYPAEANGTNDGASREVGEPRPCGELERTIWYSWVAPVSGRVQVDTRGSQFDADIAVYQGNAFGDLELVGCDSDAYWMQARVGFDAVEGQRYLIQLGCNCGYGNTAAVSVGPEEEFGRLGGLVTDEDGRPIADVCVAINSEDRMAGVSVGTGADGRWQIEIGPGRYYLGFVDCASPTQQRYRSEWWDDQPTEETAEPVTVPPGESVDVTVVLAATGPQRPVDVGVEDILLRRALPSELIEDPRPWRVVVALGHLAGGEAEPVELDVWASPVTVGLGDRFGEASLVLEPGATVEVVLPWDGSRIVGDGEIQAFLYPVAGPDLDPRNDHRTQRVTTTGVGVGVGVRPA